MRRLSFVSTFALTIGLLALSQAAHAQALMDYATTQDQETVASTFDAKGSTATSGSSLETDYNRVLTDNAISINSSVQSMLPTTAYALTGVANSAASIEESNIMSRVRALRNQGMMPTRHVAPPATRPSSSIKPLQETEESLHDLRGESKTPKLTNARGTQKYYRLTSPLRYTGTSNAKPASDTTWVEDAYEESMRLATIGAGAPNEYYRNTTGKHNLRIVPNMADRATTKILKFAGDLGGQGQINATATGGMPRRIVPMMTEDKRANSLYRGQPLSTLARSNEEVYVPQPMPVTAPPAPTSLAAPAPLKAPSSEPTQLLGSYSNTPPVIYGADEIEPPVIQTPDDSSALETPAPVPSKPAPAPFVYKRIDQKSGFTTPQLGSPTSSSLQIQQPNKYAVAKLADETRMGMVTPPRRTTESGTLLWTNDGKSVAQPTATTETTSKPVIYPAKSEEPTPQYGTKAVLANEAPINIDRRWGFFLSGNTGFGSNELQSGSAKTKTVTTGITTGVDYRLQQKSYVGMAVTYVHNSLTTGNYGDLQAHSTALSVYGTTDYAKNAYVDGYLSIGYHTMDSERTIFAGNNSTRKATASPDGIQFNGKVETGYDIKDQTASMQFGPFAGFRLAYADFNDFTEENAGNFNLKVQGLDNLSAIGALGIGGAKRFAMSNGGSVLPALRVGYNHEFGDDRSSVKAEFANLANSSFTTKGEKRSRDWINVSPSITAALPNDWTFHAQYEHDFFRDDSSENIFNLAAHYKW